jgi:hypothetical protein
MPKMLDPRRAGVNHHAATSPSQALDGALHSSSRRLRILTSFLLAGTPSPSPRFTRRSPHAYHQGVHNPPRRPPGTLGKLCQTLAEEDVNILAYQQFPHEKGKGSVRLVVDNPDKTRTTLDRQRTDYSESEVAKVMLANRPGELARVASRLGDQGININYGYSGAEPGANASFLIVGVADAGKAVKLLEQAAAAGTTT